MTDCQTLRYLTRHEQGLKEPDTLGSGAQHPPESWLKEVPGARDSVKKGGWEEAPRFQKTLRIQMEIRTELGFAES